MPQRSADSVLHSWPTHVATAVATGLVTTYLPVQRWGRPARWALHGGMAALAGGGMAYVLRRPEARRFVPGDTSRDDEPREPVAALPAVAIGTGLGALVLAASRGGEAADEWAERRLSARGVRRPRVWMGLAAAGASLAMSVSDSRREAREASSPTSSDG